jgi:hypothetical protein
MKKLEYNSGGMRRRFIISALSIALFLVLTHCDKRCEEFNYDIVQWLPYEESDRIPISNTTNLDTLMVVSREITHTDSYPIFSCCACINSYSIKLASTSLAIQAFYFDSRSYVGSSIHINNEDLIFNAHYDTYEINGKEYSDVLEYINYQKDQSKYFSKIIIVNGIGIVSIVGSNDDWIITDFSAREIDPKKIHKVTEDC